MPDDELSTRLLADAENYDPAAHTRSLLAPHRDTLLLMRAKFMSYEQISATLAKHGLNVSPTAIGVFCRRNFTKAEIDRLRREHTRRPAPPPADQLPGLVTQTPPPPRLQKVAVPTEPGRRGPRIARDDI
jgi:hypothetical protein